MKTEIEKKYFYSEHDMQIIDEKCEFSGEKTVVDKYLDTIDFIITAQGKKVRVRDGKPELKIKKKNNTTNGHSESIELDTIEEINEELSKIGVKFEELKEVLTVKTDRKKYKYNYKGLDFVIDIDIFKYGKRYEIELTYDNDIIVDAPALIDELRLHLGLTSEQNLGNGKIAICAEQDNPIMFRIIMETTQKIENITK